MKPILKCFLNKDKDILNILYYNPNGNDDKGQYVWLKINKTSINNIINNTKNDQDCIDLIESSAKTYLIDKSDDEVKNQEFKYIDVLFNSLKSIKELNKKTLSNIFKNNDITVLWIIIKNKYNKKIAMNDSMAENIRIRKEI